MSLIENCFRDNAELRNLLDHERSRRLAAESRIRRAVEAMKEGDPCPSCEAAAAILESKDE